MSFLQVCATVTRFPHAGSTLWERDQLQRRRRVNERVVRDDRERKEGAEKRRRRRKYKQNWRVEERRRSPLRFWVSTSQFTEFTVNRLMDLHDKHTWYFVQQYSQLSSLWCVQVQHFGRDIKNVIAFVTARSLTCYQQFPQRHVELTSSSYNSSRIQPNII